MVQRIEWGFRTTIVVCDSLNTKFVLMKTFLEPAELRSRMGMRVLILSCSNIQQMVNLPSKSLHKLGKFSGLPVIFQPIPNFLSASERIICKSVEREVQIRLWKGKHFAIVRKHESEIRAQILTCSILPTAGLFVRNWESCP